MRRMTTISLYRSILELSSLAKKFADAAKGPHGKSYAAAARKLNKAADRIAGLDDAIDIESIVTEVTR